jgi:exodeoxyribonuclease V gamma subunit
MPLGGAISLYRSNRSERLVDMLAQVVQRPLSDPLSPELIVVQSKGMERWLAMQLSLRLRVWGNAQFPFPRHLLERVFDAAPGEAAGASAESIGTAPALTPSGIAERVRGGAAFDERVLMWTVAALLPAHTGEPAFAPIARYLEHDHDGVLRMQLAARIARVFDDYAVYRPELLLRFERGEEAGWDALLWRALVARLGRGHQAARAERFIAALRAGTIERSVLPERLCLFGISTLPPLYLSVLSALAEHVDTHMFVLSPSREYWGDVQKPRAPDARSESAGHPLLSSFGRLGREFQNLLEDRARYTESELDLYEDPGEGCLLHTLQSDMLALRNRGATDDSVPRAPLAADDDSLAIHVCHSPMREIEVLHDQLCAVLEDPRIEPHDIVVMTPDIETYAPVIEAVFGQKGGRPQLPYSVSDRKTRTTHEVVDALYALAEALSGRLSASSVLDLLTFDCIRTRLSIASEELDTLRAWIERSAIAWGADAEHRIEVGQPGFSDNTWRSGLERMLLGYAMSSTAPALGGGAAIEGGGQRLYEGVLPLDEIEGGAGELLGKLAELCERLFRHRDALRVPRTMPAWREALLALLADLVHAGPSTAHEHQLIAAALAGLTDSAERAGFADTLELRGVLAQLERALDERLPARGLLARGITFCQLVPMRSIPFQVVCLVGMNDDAFPGRNTLIGFDRMSDRSERRAGDRSRRDDDRYMALEAVLCARRRLIITYIGRGIHDNRVIPPSVVVGELIDAVAQGFDVADAEQRLCTIHRLHAFSPRYFDAGADPQLFSYAKHYREGARALGHERTNPPLLDGPLPPATIEELTIEDLVAWVTKPIERFMQQRLGLYLGNDLAPLAEREPLELDQLERWKLGSDLLELAESGADLRELLPIARGAGALPLGTVGSVVYDKLVPGVGRIATAAKRYRAGERLAPIGVSLDIDGVRLTGTLHGLWPNAQLLTTYSRIGKRFELAHFVRHVVLNYVLEQQAHPGYPRTSAIVARVADGKRDEAAEVAFAPIAEPKAALRALLSFVRDAQRKPLPCIYEVTHAYAEGLRAAPDKNGTTDLHDRALDRARKEFEAKFGAQENPYVKLVYPEFSELIADDGPAGFVALAHALFDPFFDHRSGV